VKSAEKLLVQPKNIGNTIEIFRCIRESEQELKTKMWSEQSAIKK